MEAGGAREAFDADNGRTLERGLMAVLIMIDQWHAVAWSSMGSLWARSYRLNSNIMVASGDVYASASVN